MADPQSQTTEYYIKRNGNNGHEYYLSDFDFRNISDVEWCCSVKYAFPFSTFKAALGLKTYIEETESEYSKMTIIKVTTIIENVEGEE